MNIVVIVENQRVKEVIVPDASVKVVVLDLDDAGGSDTVAIGNDEEAAIDAAACVRQTVDTVRLNALLQAVKAGLDELPDSDQVQAVRALIQNGYPRA